jgi:hypothetical protein
MEKNNFSCPVSDENNFHAKTSTTTIVKLMQNISISVNYTDFFSFIMTFESYDHFKVTLVIYNAKVIKYEEWTKFINNDVSVLYIPNEKNLITKIEKNGNVLTFYNTDITVINETKIQIQIGMQIFNKKLGKIIEDLHSSNELL